MHCACTVACTPDTLHVQESELLALKPKYEASLAAVERAEQGQAAAEERARALEQQLAQRAGGGGDDPAPTTRSAPPPTEARAWAAQQAVADVAGPAGTLGAMERQSSPVGVAASASARPSVGLGPGSAPDAAAPGQLEQRAPPMQSLHTSSRRRNSSTSKRSFMDMRLPTDIDPHAFAPVTPRPATSALGPAPSFVPLPPNTHVPSPEAAAAPGSAPVPAPVPTPTRPPARAVTAPRSAPRPAETEKESTPPAGPLVGRAPKASRHAPKAADTPGREEAMLPPSKPSSKSRGKVQKTFGRKQPAAGRAGAASPEALDVFGGM